MTRKLEPGSLREALRLRTEAALACGALRPIETIQEWIEDCGVRFPVRRVSNLARKAEERRTRAASGLNPFLPCEAELFVADVSDSHVALLNKFNVIERHLLIVTRDFEHQERLLGRADFEALWTCLAEYDSLGFYNAGQVAGASQPHKHLQTVPLPLAQQGPPVPIEPLLRGAPREGLCTLPVLPFSHAFCRLPPGIERDPSAAQFTEAIYRHLLQAVGITELAAADGPRQSAPYNLLVARGWMLLVPRSRECFDSISINALGYAGSLFVRDDAQLQRVKQAGPMAVLTAVGRPREPGY